MTALGLTAKDCMAQVWFLAENGRLTGGATAVNEVMKRVWWLRPFAYLFHIPGLKQLEMYAYRWVANNRYWLPGGSPICAVKIEGDQ